MEKKTAISVGFLNEYFFYEVYLPFLCHSLYLLCVAGSSKT